MTREEALRVLGLAADATPEEVKIAHRELAQMLHPDKFSDNKRLMARAEQQMKTVNEARDTLLRGAGGPHTASGSRGTSRSGGGASSPPARSVAEIAFEAEARAHAAETARLTVVAQARTLRERRHSMVIMSVAAGLVALATSRAAGLIGSFAFSIASMVTVWGVVDTVMLSNQAAALSRRAADLMRQRDAARRVADEARKMV